MKIPMSHLRKDNQRKTVVDTRKVAEEVVAFLDKEDTTPGDYISLKNTIRRATESNSTKITRRTQLIYQSREVRQAVKARRMDKRRLQDAQSRNNDRDTALLEQVLKASDQVVFMEKERERRETERKQYEWILQAPRQERAFRYWGYIRKLNQKEPKKTTVRDTDGRTVSLTDMKQHLTDIAGDLLNARKKRDTGPVRLVGEDTGIRTTPQEVERVLGSMSSRSATGLDAIPATILKRLGALGNAYIATLFNGILAGKDEIPRDWSMGRVSLLEKGTSRKGNLNTYRPITISAVLYRLLAKIICNRIDTWMEENEILGEMQNGFRSKRRGDDNIFMLTSMIEMARKQEKGLICAFLDASRAYDKVNRGMLWNILDHHGMNHTWITMIKLLYEDNCLIVQHGEHASEKMETTEGLRQGCPMSPILFAMYIAELELRLLRANKGFSVQYWNLIEKRNFRIPGLLFADDLVLVGHTYQTIEALLNITTDVGNELQLTFNP
ncbi:MAG TPA: reverse transcriptase family protein, partial [Bacteroidia bacterium]|nr:reverse transcriptase family protein [Bacteroidia bacterium]